MGSCCSSANVQDDEFELSTRPGGTTHTHPSEVATLGSTLPPRASISAPPTTESMAFSVSTAAATETSGPDRFSSDHGPSTSSHAHIPDWDWERRSSSDYPSTQSRPESDAPAPPSSQAHPRPRARVESTATTRELRYVLNRALSGRPPSRQGGSEQPRGRTEGVRFGEQRQPREHAPDRFAMGAQLESGREGTVPWPAASDAQ